uniref:Uncharacterized protein n=1 Tax=Rhizobium rhizogenes TaxID=359 RepID=A0A7S5DRX5_RHIRH|nr:hypothetical protein pC5.8b_270 [Rhizobium rhizogenes]
MWASPCLIVSLVVIGTLFTRFVAIRSQSHDLIQVEQHRSFADRMRNR